MTADSLRPFLTLCEIQHFGRASRACHLSPSALTRHIQRLEEEVGQALFTRDNRSVQLTRAGEAYRRYARKVVQDWETLQVELSQDEAVQGIVSIYASVTAVHSILPELLESYRLSYPQVQLALRTGAAEEAVPQVLSGEIDLAVAAAPDRRPGKLEFLPLKQTALVFITQKGLPVPRSRSMLDLAKATLVLPELGLSRRRLDAYLKGKNIQPQITTEVSGNEAIIAMVRLGCGIGLVPELVLEKSPFREEVEIISKAPPLAPYEVGLCSTKKALSHPAVQAFWDLLPEVSSIN